MQQETGPSSSAEPTSRLVEKRAIEYIPLRERHGKAWHVTPVWIACSANLTGLAIGGIGIASGLNLGWSLLAIVVGGFVGTFFAAFHGTQGPQLGIPQMIQSRPQYGYVGAVLIYIVAVLAYLGISMFAILLMGQALGTLLGISPEVGMVVMTALATGLAIAGYDLVHKFSRWSTIAFVVALPLLAIATPFVTNLPTGSAALSSDGFNGTAFMMEASAMAVGTLSWAPYVSDYTRYLPRMSTKAAFFGTYLGMSITGIVVASVGALLAAGLPGVDLGQALVTVGNGVFNGLGSILLIITLVGTAVLVCMNTYGGALTVMSIADSVRPSKPRPIVRPIVATAFGATSLILALQATGAFAANFYNFLTILFYALAPWTATNLVDYFFVRRGHYSIREIFNPRGMYGRWNWRGYTAYGASMLAMAPFALTAWWSGPIGSMLGFDIAPFVGMAVSGLVYLGLARSLDLEGERRKIIQADTGLEDWAETRTHNTAENTGLALVVKKEGI